MKQKKPSLHIISTLSQLILQLRIPSISQKSLSKQVHKKISQIHLRQIYDEELNTKLIEKPEYSIQQKLSTKENRMIRNHCVLIRFKIIQKTYSTVSYVEAWMVSVEKDTQQYQNQINNYNQQFVYLVQEVLKAIKCQFLSNFVHKSVQLKHKYMLDYQIQINPIKKRIKKLCFPFWSSQWSKQIQLQPTSCLSVSCYHNHPCIPLTVNTYPSPFPIFKPLKHGSQQTKPSNSLNSQTQPSFVLSIEQTAYKIQQIPYTIEQIPSNDKRRKTSLIQFRDQELDITVLSNDSQSFKKSTGKVINQDFFFQDDSQDQFQLLVQEDQIQPVYSQKSIIFNRFSIIQTPINQLFQSFDQNLSTYFS